MFEREINIGGMEAAGVGGGTFRFKVEPLMEILMANNNASNIYNHTLSMANNLPRILDPIP